MEEIKVKIDGEEFSVQIEENECGKFNVMFDGSVYELETRQDIKEDIIEEVANKKRDDQKGIILSPLPGTIAEINCKPGQKVKTGDSLIKLVAMKMENNIKSDKDGIVKDIKIKKNDNVNKGDILIIIG